MGNWLIRTRSFLVDAVDGVPRGDVTMKLDVGEGLLPELERAAAECAWWDGNDPCFLRLNASVAEQRRAQRHGCGNL